MKKGLCFDFLITLLIGLLLTVILSFEKLEQSVVLRFIPILAFYLIGKYAGRKFKE